MKRIAKNPLILSNVKVASLATSSSISIAIEVNKGLFVLLMVLIVAIRVVDDDVTVGIVLSINPLLLILYFRVWSVSFRLDGFERGRSAVISWVGLSDDVWVLVNFIHLGNAPFKVVMMPIMVFVETCREVLGSIVVSVFRCTITVAHFKVLVAFSFRGVKRRKRISKLRGKN